VFGVLERNGVVQVTVVPDVTADTDSEEGPKRQCRVYR